MSALAAQLSALTAPASSSKTQKQYFPSLVFANWKEASDMDTDAFFAIGCSGLAGLVSAAPGAGFEAFAENLFSDALKTTDRLLLDKAENKALDSLVNSFLVLVSPHMLQPSAFKALEWLLRRFRIHEFSVDELIRAALPFHDTWQFIRVLGTLKLSGKWGWLQGLRDRKVSLDRKTLVQRCIKDLLLVQFICDMVEKLLIPNATNASLCSFFTGTMIEFISSTRMTDDLMRMMMPCLFAMAAMDVANVQAAAYMTMAHLSNKAPFSVSIISAMSDVVISHASPQLSKHAACCLVSLYDSQESCPNLSGDALEVLIGDSFWRDTLAEVLAVYQGDGLVFTVIRSFYEQRQSNPNISYSNFLDLIKSVGMSAPLAEQLCKLVLQDAPHVIQSGSKDDLTAVKKLLIHISKSFPLVLNGAVATMATSANNLASKSSKGKKLANDQIFDLVSSTFSGTAHEPLKNSNTTLYLSLQHADNEIRHIGFIKLSDMLKSNNMTASIISTNPDLKFIPNMLAAALSDSDERICALVVSDVPDLVEFLALTNGGTEALIELAIDTKKSNAMLLKHLVSHLVKLDVGHSVYGARVTQAITSFFLVEKHMFSVFEHAASALKSSRSGVSALFAGCDALGKELKKAEVTHAGNEKGFTAALEDIQDRVVSLISSNAMKDTSKLSLEILLGGLRCSISATRTLTAMILAYIIQSPQYNLEKLSVSGAVVTTITGMDLAELMEGLDAGSAESLAILGCLSAVVLSLPIARKQSPIPAVEYCKNLEKDVFEVLLRLRRNQKCHKLMENFFVLHLKADTIQFLVNLSTSEDVSDSVKGQSLRLVSVLLQTEAKSPQIRDFQVTIPSLLVCLTRDSKVIREEAIHCLKAIKKIEESVIALTTKKSTVPVFAFDTFYGSASSKVKFLLPGTVDAFVSLLLETSQEFATDSTQIVRRLSQVLFQKPLDHTQSDNVLTFLTTSILAMESPISKRGLLAVLAEVHVPQKVKALQPLLDTVFGNGETVTPSASEDETKLRLAFIDLFDATTVNATFGYKGGRFLNLFVRIIASANEFESLKAIELISRPWFANVTAHHQPIFSALVQVASRSSKNVAAAAKRAMRHIDVSADIVLNIIRACKSTIGTSSSVDQPSKKSKGDMVELAGINELITVLELLDSESSIISRGDLLGPLFELLGFILPFDDSRLPISLEYLKQLLITAKLHIVKELKSTNSLVDESVVRVDLIVNCIRVSENPQTHNEALLLMAELAEVYPNTVLLNVIPIFTFMGANVLRRDDDYSFHVIQQTLEAIIPPLIRKSRSSKSKLDVKSIIDVFIDSIFHIPRHRRLRLFTILVSTLGPSDFLDSVIMMLLLKSSQRFSDIALVNPSDIQSLSPFCLQLIENFPRLVQFKAMADIADSVRLLPTDASAPAIKSIGSVAMDLKALSPQECKHFKLVCLDFVNSALAARVSEHTAASEEQDELVHSIFQTALMLIVENLGAKAFKAQTSDSKSTFYRSFSKRLNSILSHLNHLMSLPTFLDLSLSLLIHEDTSIQVRITDLVKEKLPYVTVKDYEENVTQFKAIYSQLSSALAEDDSSSSVGLKIASVECINAIISKYASSDPQAFVEILPVLIKPNILEHESRLIRMAALDCIGSTMQQLGARIIPYVKTIMNGVFSILKQLSRDFELDPACVSALVCADLAITILPQFMSPFVPDILQCMFLPFDKLTGPKDTVSKFRTTKQDLAGNIAKKISVRVLIPTLSAQVAVCFKLGSLATLELFEVASMTIANMEKNDLVVYLNDLVKFFLTSFEFRKTYHTSLPAGDIDKVEGSIIAAFMQLVLRLNESHFKPMFFKLVDWAFNISTGVIASNKENVMFFFRLMVSLLDKLKTIFSPYILHLVDTSIEILNHYKLESEADKTWELVMQTLQKFLQYSSGPVSEEVFTKLAKCLTSQIDLVSLHSQRKYLVNMTRYIVPTVGLLAVNIGKESMWKIINKEVMRKSRSDDVLCRIVTCNAMQEFYVQLGEEFLIMLPETVPTIAELMEDSDERVQVAVQELTAEIQKHLGEDLNSYFS
ncbi:hypothetical protein BC830DRAFT_1104805 [Chytriomyces sp. MP71]|nr:hypothetical protein BC830DRAFT_1104805 [Chytriomyces sp. MP71]